MFSWAGGGVVQISRVESFSTLSGVAAAVVADNGLGSGLVVDADGDIVFAGPSYPTGPPIIDCVGCPGVITSGPPLLLPNGLDIEADGQLIVADTNLIRVDPDTGVQTFLIGSPSGVYKEAIVDRLKGDLILNDGGGIRRYDPGTGSYATILLERSSPTTIRTWALSRRPTYRSGSISEPPAGRTSTPT